MLTICVVKFAVFLDDYTLGVATVTVTTGSFIFLVGDPYKPSFATGILGGGHPQIIPSYFLRLFHHKDPGT